MKTTYIYAIRDLGIDKFVYIGKSNDPQGRFKGHINGSSNEGIQGLIKERGEANFCLEVLEIVEFEVSEDWTKREKFWVRKFRGEGHPLCNKNDGGGGLSHHTEETIAKISQTKMGHEVTEETKAKLSKANLGKHHTEETRAAMSERTKGEGNPMHGRIGKDHPGYGKPRSEETRRKIGNANRGRILGPISDESRRKNSEWHLKYYETHSQWNKGKSSHMKGKHHAPETLDKMAKVYPAFFNELTDVLIPEGHNLAKLCYRRGFKYAAIYTIKIGANKQTKDGWRLATESEIASRSMSP